jgi:transposase
MIVVRHIQHIVAFPAVRIDDAVGQALHSAFDYEGSACHLSTEQRQRLKLWIAETLPRTTRHVGAWIEREFGIVYQSRSGLIALLHRLGIEHRKPQSVSRKLDEAAQQGFIEAYDTLLNTFGRPPLSGPF